jgi:hypothetical protein
MSNTIANHHFTHAPKDRVDAFVAAFFLSALPDQKKAPATGTAER